jgi:hypothetical protein
MATKVFKIDSSTDARRFAQAYAKGISKPILNALPYFKLLSLQINRDVQQQFRNEGASGGPRKIPNEFTWKPFSINTLLTKSGKFKKRPGTDESKTRRYSFNSKLLKASGSYRKSFRTTRLWKNGMKYQTVHELGGKIGTNPFRPVLFVTDFDLLRYNSMWQKFIDRGIKF